MDYETVRELFDYDPETGNLVWKKRGKAVQVGKAAGSVNSRGYLNVSVKGRIYLGHRLVWLYHHGQWPEVIDHINHNKLDNRIENLRDVGSVENNRNMAGVKGVCFDNTKGKWKAYIQRKHLGSFENQEDAIAARRAALVEYGFHSNHGSI